MRKFLSLILISTIVFFISTNAHAAINEADAKYAQAAGKATQDFSTAIGNWGDTYQAAPDKVNSAAYRNWIKQALAADKDVKKALNNFSKIKVSSGYKNLILVSGNSLKPITVRLIYTLLLSRRMTES